MTNLLLGCDPKEVSPARAGATFSEFAKKLATESGIDFTAAWNRAKLLHPDLHARMCEKPPAEPAEPSALGNSILGAPVPPGLSKAFQLPLMQLPSDTTDAEFQAAWNANGCKSSPLDAQNVFLALVAFTAGQQNVTVAIARRMVQDRFPGLAAVAGQKVG